MGARARFAPYLLADEKLKWVGRPGQGLAVTAIDALLIPFSIFWCGFIVVWIYIAAQHSLEFALFAIPFVLMGLFLLIGRFLIDAWMRSNIFYAVTDQRALVLRGVFGTSVSSYDVGPGQNMHLKLSEKSIGTIVFGETSPFAGFGNFDLSKLYLSASAKNKFFRIENVQHVYKLLIENK